MQYFLSVPFYKRGKWLAPVKDKNFWTQAFNEPRGKVTRFCHSLSIRKYQNAVRTGPDIIVDNPRHTELSARNRGTRAVTICQHSRHETSHAAALSLCVVNCNFAAAHVHSYTTCYTSQLAGGIAEVSGTAESRISTT